MISAMAAPSFMTVSPLMLAGLVRPICISWNRIFRLGKARGGMRAEVLICVLTAAAGLSS